MDTIEGGHTGHFFNIQWTAIAASHAPAKDYRSAMDQIGWYWGNSADWTQPVAQLIPNAWGLYDMHGNLFKWVQGYWRLYTPDPEIDPTGGDSGRYLVARGGAWSRPPFYARSAFRAPRELDYDGPKTGFRPVCTANPN